MKNNVSFMEYHQMLKDYRFYLGKNEVDIWELYWSGYDYIKVLRKQTKVKVFNKVI